MKQARRPFCPIIHAKQSTSGATAPDFGELPARQDPHLKLPAAGSAGCDMRNAQDLQPTTYDLRQRKMRTGVITSNAWSPEAAMHDQGRKAKLLPCSCDCDRERRGGGGDGIGE